MDGRWGLAVGMVKGLRSDWLPWIGNPRMGDGVLLYLWKSASRRAWGFTADGRYNHWLRAGTSH